MRYVTILCYENILKLEPRDYAALICTILTVVLIFVKSNFRICLIFLLKCIVIYTTLWFKIACSVYVCSYVLLTNKRERLKSFICPTNAQLNCFKMLKFTLRFTINASTCFGLTKPSSGNLQSVLR